MTEPSTSYEHLPFLTEKSTENFSGAISMEMVLAHLSASGVDGGRLVDRVRHFERWCFAWLPPSALSSSSGPGEEVSSHCGFGLRGLPIFVLDGEVHHGRAHVALALENGWRVLALLPEQQLAALQVEKSPFRESEDVKFERHCASLSREIWKDPRAFLTFMYESYGGGPFDYACLPVAFAIKEHLAEGRAAAAVYALTDRKNVAHHAVVVDRRRPGFLWDASGSWKTPAYIEHYNEKENARIVGLRALSDDDFECSQHWINRSGIRKLRSFMNSQI